MHGMSAPCKACSPFHVMPSCRTIVALNGLDDLLAKLNDLKRLACPMVQVPIFAAAAALLAVPAQLSAGPPAKAAASSQVLPQAALEAAAAVDGFHAALRRGDPAAALVLVADEALVFEEGRAERSKAEYAAHHAAADAAFSRAVPSVRSRRTGHAAADLAWIASESRTRGRFKGQDVDRIMVETMVLRRDPRGAWKIVHIHWSLAQPSTE